MVTLDLTDEQAKMLLIVTGNMAGTNGSRGVFQKLMGHLGVRFDGVPDPYLNAQHNTIIVSDALIESIKTN